MTFLALLWTGIKFVLSAATLAYSIAGYFGSPDEVETESPTYGWGGIQTPSSPDNPIPILNGTHKVGGNVIGAFNTRQYLKMLIALGEGVLDSISDVRVNGNPIGNLPDASYVFRDGSNTQSIIPGYEEQINQVAHSNWNLNSLGATYTYTTSDSIDAFEVMLVYPFGHYRQDKYGKDAGVPKEYGAWYKIEYRKQGGGGWTTNNYIDGYKKVQPDYKYYRVDVSGDPGIYEIKVTRTSAYPDDDFYEGTVHVSKLRWDATKEINYDAMTYPNTALLAVTLKASDKISGGMPTVSCIAKGIEVIANPTYWAAGWSDNPARCLYNILLNSRYGTGNRLAAADLDAASFDTAATYCDNLVDDGNGGTEKRAILDLVIDTRMDAIDAINVIRSSFGGILNWQNGKLALEIDKVTAASQSFDDTAGGLDNIIEGSLSYSWMPLDRVPNLLEIGYYDRAEDYRRMTIQVGDESAFIAGTPIRKHRMTALGVSRQSQATRIGFIAMNHAKYGELLCEFKAGMRDVQCEAGDVIQITFSHAGWTDKKFRVMEIRRAEDYQLALICRSYDDLQYDFTGLVVDAQPADPMPNPGLLPESVENLSVTSNEQPPGLIVSFTPPLEDPRTGGVQNYDPNWSHGRIYIRRKDDVWRYHGYEETGEYYIIPGAELVPGKRYEIRVVSVSHDGVPEDITTAPTVEVVYDPSPEIEPPNVMGLEIKGQGLNTEFTGKDCKFEWRHTSLVTGAGTDFADSPDLGAGAGSQDPYHQDYQVKIYIDDIEVRTEFVTDNSFVYSYEKNCEDNKDIDGNPDPQRSFTIKVWARNTFNRVSWIPATLAVSNPQLAPPANIQISSTPLNIHLTWDPSSETDAGGYEVHVSTTASFTPGAATLFYDGVDSGVTIAVSLGKKYYIKVGAYDTFGKTGMTYSAELDNEVETSTNLLAWYLEANFPAGTPKNTYREAVYGFSHIVQPGHRLEYEVLFEEDSVDQRGGFDLWNADDAQALRSTAAVDQNGLSASPDTLLESYAKNRWYHRVIDLPATWDGDEIDDAATAMDNADAGISKMWIRNPRITDSSGVVQVFISRYGFSDQSVWAHGTEQGVTGVSYDIQTYGMASTGGLVTLAVTRGARATNADSGQHATTGEAVMATFSNMGFKVTTLDTFRLLFHTQLNVWTNGAVNVTATFRIRRTNISGTIIFQGSLPVPSTKTSGWYADWFHDFDIDANAGLGQVTYVLTLQNSHSATNIKSVCKNTKIQNGVRSV